MLNIHHERIISRLLNIMDTLLHRHSSPSTVADETCFLALEIESYRAFVMAHADELHKKAALPPDHDPRAEADTLFSEILTLRDIIMENSAFDHRVLPHAGRLSDRLQRHASHFNQGTPEQQWA